MPLFEYRCRECGSLTEILTGVSSQDDKLACATCGSPNLGKLVSSIALVRQTPDTACGLDRKSTGCHGDCACHNH